MSVPHSHPSNDSGEKEVSKSFRPNPTSILIIETTPAACYRGIAHWNHICQLCLKGAEKIKDNRTESVRDRRLDIPIEIGTASNSNQTVRVGEFTEHPNLVVVLKAGSYNGHRAKSLLQLCKHSQSVDC